MSISTNPWTWVMGLGMLAIFSFIYNENPAYRLAEHIYVGAAAGYSVVVNYGNIVDRAITPVVSQGSYSLLIPLVLGLLLYARFIKKIAWLSRWAVAFLLGIGVGVATFGEIHSVLVAQIRASMMPLVVRDSAGLFLLGRSINNWIMVAGTLSVLLYFFFSVEQKGIMRRSASFGRIVMMITFGVAFGNVVMGRISLLLGSMERIFGTWLGLL